jgi:hypothetical protein
MLGKRKGHKTSKEQTPMRNKEKRNEKQKKGKGNVTGGRVCERQG